MSAIKIATNFHKTAILTLRSLALWFSHDWVYCHSIPIYVCQISCGFGRHRKSAESQSKYVLYLVSGLDSRSIAQLIRSQNFLILASVISTFCCKYHGRCETLRSYLKSLFNFLSLGRYFKLCFHVSMSKYCTWNAVVSPWTLFG